MRIGLVVILIGVAYLLKNMQLIDSATFSLLWPIITIFIGVSIVSRSHCRYHGFDCNKKLCRGPKTCFCNCEKCAECDTHQS